MSYGANVDAADLNGWTALMLAALHDHFQSVKVRCGLQFQL